MTRFTRVLHKDSFKKRECTSAKEVDGCEVRTHDSSGVELRALPLSYCVGYENHGENRLFEVHFCLVN